MGDAHVLPSARLRTARDNLAEFVRRAREDVAAFGPDLDFHAVAWERRAHLAARVSAAPPARLWFTANPMVRGAVPEPLPEPFGSFARALVRLRHDSKRRTTDDVMVRALRYVHEALRHKGGDPARLSGADLGAAASLCKRRETEESCYRVGFMLVEVADWVNRYNLSLARVDFRNPFHRPDDGSRFGKRADERRARKLPSEEVLDALARLANLVTEPSDVLRMRVVELLVCGGWRIGEVLTLPVPFGVLDFPTESGKPVLDSAGNHVWRLGVRYFAEKGGGPRIKWIPTPMVGVAVRALHDIARITEPSRDAAVWMAANPGRALLPEGWRERPDDDVFALPELVEMFKLHPNATAHLIRRLGLETRVAGGRRFALRREALEAALLRAQEPELISDVPLERHEHLLLMPRNWSHAQRGTIESIVVHVKASTIRDFVAGSQGIRSAFERFGFRDGDGEPLRMNSHQLRHWLNTMAQRGGMSQLEIARWSGRKDVGQNAAYDHVSAVEMAERARGLLAAGKVEGPVREVHDRLPPVRRESFREARFATAHTTDIGMCANDWSLVPCTRHGSCADCEEHLVVKGDAGQARRAADMLSEHELLLAKAEEEAGDGTYGAANFVEHHRRVRDALRAVLAVHADPSVPDGTLVQLPR